MPVTQSQKLPSLPSLNGPSSSLKSPTRRLSVSLSLRYNPISVSTRCDVSIARIHKDRGSLASPRGSSKTTSTWSLSSIPQQSPVHGRAATTPIQRPLKRRVPVKLSQFPSGLPTLPSTSLPPLLGRPSSKCNQVATQLPSTHQSPVNDSLFAPLRLQLPPGGTSRGHLFEVGDRVVVQKYYEEYAMRSERMQGRYVYTTVDNTEVLTQAQPGHDRFCWNFLVDADNVQCYGKVGDEMWDTKGRVLPISARTLHPGRFVKEPEIMLTSVWVPATAVETDSKGMLPLVVRPINGQDRGMDFRTATAVTQAAFESSNTTTVERYFHRFAFFDLSSYFSGFITFRRAGDHDELEENTSVSNIPMPVKCGKDIHKSQKRKRNLMTHLHLGRKEEFLDLDRKTR
ncbi:uncharacterized protein LACBIDRAFT_331373 [Laccaria bicolor S238N-H82]|uniref:Predicted protein n=1 Tax=Laccaria bicolor (strain S238N-H82 / ATCC MYA-4686) TaxID=486041 RepID=B0DPA7_LACBS|nr:uncharacterized protein LACBIDRAFT_331373 [Laccaria bicolor S238N-H82]EDR03651.1 predicted protein [Laccaria bicolor S238N-H82]|eukprot:XP_001885799.1 predicted protein [Laccaria bicolor S238N-H82]